MKTERVSKVPSPKGKSRSLRSPQKGMVNCFDLLAEISNDLLFLQKPEDIAERVSAKLLKPLGLDTFVSYLSVTGTQNLRLNTVSGVGEDAFSGTALVPVNEVIGEDHSGGIFENVHQSDDPRTRIARRVGMAVYAVYPLLCNGRVIGVFCFGSCQRSGFHPDELKLMETVCNQAAISIERQRKEDALQDLNRVLEQRVAERTIQLKESNDQMEAFAYSVSHDLRAPLRTIRGFSQAILEEYQQVLDETGRDYLRRLVDGSDRLDRLIQDLLEYSRVGRSKLTFEPVSLDQCVKDVLKQLEQDIQSNHAEISVHQQLGSAVGHRPTLDQAIINLLSNALKFVEQGKRPAVTIRSQANAGVVRLWIEDDGIGIAPEHQGRIFGVFERLHSEEEYPGTGIGLAIVAKAMARLGGRVGLESSVGAGSRFWIELPEG